MNKDKLEQVMLDGYPRGEKKYGEDEKECRKEFESVKGSRIKDILDNITKRDKMDAIIKDKRAVTRKDLIFLNFLIELFLVMEKKGLYMMANMEKSQNIILI